MSDTDKPRPGALPPSAWLAIGAAALGGMLYGYDIGITAGALVFMEPTLSLSASEVLLIVAAVLGGGSMAASYPGRIRCSLICGS